MRTSLSSPPSIVMISRMRGDVEVRYVRCVKELNNGRGEFVSRAEKAKVSREIEKDIRCHETRTMKLSEWTDAASARCR